MPAETGRRSDSGEFGIAIADAGYGALLDALEAAPFSDELKRLLWDELLDPDRTKSGPDGVIDYAHLSALGVGADDLVAGVNLGRAGKALVAALRALSGLALDEVGDGGHDALPGQIEIPPSCWVM